MYTKTFLGCEAYIFFIIAHIQNCIKIHVTKRFPYYKSNSEPASSDSLWGINVTKNIKRHHRNN